MAEAALRQMSLDEFYAWDDQTDTRYELVAGVPVAMAPPAEAHRILSANMAASLRAALVTRRPCNAQTEAGITRADRSDSYFVADIAATCIPNERGQQAIANPFLIVEILSPSTERHDRRVKLPSYRQIDSVQEIVLIASDDIYAELHRRSGAQWITEIVRGADSRLNLTSVPVEIAMGELYEGIDLSAEEAE